MAYLILTLFYVLCSSQDLTGYDVYQPISAVSPINDTVAYDTSSESSYVTVTAVDSYTFVNAVFQNLANFGLDLEAFLDVYASAFVYAVNDTATAAASDVLTDFSVQSEPQQKTHVKVHTAANTQLRPQRQQTHRSPRLVSWSPLLSSLSTSSTDDDASNVLAPTDVFQWYSALIDCYTAAFDDVVVSGDGATAFLELITQCYANNGGYAYIYAGPQSVYNVRAHGVVFVVRKQKFDLLIAGDAIEWD